MKWGRSPRGCNLRCWAGDPGLRPCTLGTRRNDAGARAEGMKGGDGVALLPNLSFPSRTAWRCTCSCRQGNAEAITFVVTAPLLCGLGYVIFKIRYDLLNRPQVVQNAYMVCGGGGGRPVIAGGVLIY